MLFRVVLCCVFGVVLCCVLFQYGVLLFVELFRVVLPCAWLCVVVLFFFFFGGVVLCYLMM